MRRREFITLVGGAAVAWPLAARAQQGARMRLVGVLMPAPEGDPEAAARVAAFEEALAHIGWVNGRNVHLDVRWGAVDADRLHALAAELVGLRPDVILAANTPVVAALQKIAGQIPIIFVTVSDPVGSGFVQSFAHPGGNITGFSNFEASLVGKWFTLLREVAPAVRRVAALFNPRTSNGTYYLDTLRDVANNAAIPALTAEVSNDDEVDAAISKLQGDGGLIVMPDGFTNVHRKVIIAKAAKYRVPAVYPYAFMAKDGGLISYGIDIIDDYRRAATYVDRVRKSEKPTDLPTQGPTKFEFVINLKTAKSLGLAIPSGVLAIADEVIE